MTTHNLTRRKFLAYALAAAGATTGGAILLTLLDHTQQRQTSPAAHGPVDDLGDAQLAALQNIEPGSISADVMANLVALAAYYVGDNGPTSHYQTYYTFRAQTLPGYKALYESFSMALDELANEMARVAFHEASIDTRQAILGRGLGLATPEESIFAPVNPPETMDAADLLWLYYDRFIIAETIRLFTRTNGYILLGYEGWPSQPKGLENYVRPVTEVVQGGSP